MFTDHVDGLSTRFSIWTPMSSGSVHRRRFTQPITRVENPSTDVSKMMPMLTGPGDGPSTRPMYTGSVNSRVAKKYCMTMLLPRAALLAQHMLSSCVHPSVTSQYCTTRCCTETVWCTTLVNSCYVSQGMGVKKVSHSKSDTQGHSRALAMVPFDRPHTISY